MCTLGLDRRKRMSRQIRSTGRKLQVQLELLRSYTEHFDSGMIQNIAHFVSKYLTLVQGTYIKADRSVEPDLKYIVEVES